MIKNYLDDWKPMEDIGMIIDDKTAQDRTQEELNIMMEKLRDIAGDYGFDLHIWASGHLTGFKRLPKYEDMPNKKGSPFEDDYPEINKK